MTAFRRAAAIVGANPVEEDVELGDAWNGEVWGQRSGTVGWMFRNLQLNVDQAEEYGSAAKAEAASARKDIADLSQGIHTLIRDAISAYFRENPPVVHTGLSDADRAALAAAVVAEFKKEGN